MTLEEARSIVIELLCLQGVRQEQRLIHALGDDSALFERVREDLIFNDLAEDKKGVGLVYAGPFPDRPVKATAPAPRITAGAPETLVRTRRGRPTAPAERDLRQLRQGRRPRTCGATSPGTEGEGPRRLAQRERDTIRVGPATRSRPGILSHEVFIALLTPHAVRRPDGVCLDEISLARCNSRRIIPAMVIQCRPPLGIYRLDWVDFQGWTSPAGFHRAFSRLLTALDADACVEGAHARISLRSGRSTSGGRTRPSDAPLHGA